MILQCLTENEIIIDDIELLFGTKREDVRTKLSIFFKESDQEDYNQRRDIYKDLNSDFGLFFLNYDSESLLSEIEVHWCEKIRVQDIWFDFNTPVDLIAEELKKYSGVSQPTNGEYFFEKLKITILDETQMGGDGNNLSYFYYASDVSHLNMK